MADVTGNKKSWLPNLGLSVFSRFFFSSGRVEMVGI